jgi:hypothetical protein
MMYLFEGQNSVQSEVKVLEHQVERCWACTDKVSGLSISLRILVSMYFEISGVVIEISFLSGGEPAGAKYTLEDVQVKD